METVEAVGTSVPSNNIDTEGKLRRLRPRSTYSALDNLNKAHLRDFGQIPCRNIAYHNLQPPPYLFYYLRFRVVF